MWQIQLGHQWIFNSIKSLVFLCSSDWVLCLHCHLLNYFTSAFPFQLKRFLNHYLLLKSKSNKMKVKQVLLACCLAVTRLDWFTTALWYDRLWFHFQQMVHYKQLTMRNYININISLYIKYISWSGLWIIFISDKNTTIQRFVVFRDSRFRQ